MDWLWHMNTAPVRNLIVVADLFMSFGGSGQMQLFRRSIQRMTGAAALVMLISFISALKAVVP